MQKVATLAYSGLAEVFGVSIDPVKSHRRFIDKHSLPRFFTCFLPAPENWQPVPRGSLIQLNGLGFGWDRGGRQGIAAVAGRASHAGCGWPCAEAARPPLEDSDEYMRGTTTPPLLLRRVGLQEAVSRAFFAIPTGFGTLHGRGLSTSSICEHVEQVPGSGDFRGFFHKASVP